MDISIPHRFLISLLSVCGALSLCLYKKYKKHIYLEALEELNGIYNVSSPYEYICILENGLRVFLTTIAILCVLVSIVVVGLVLIILLPLTEPIRLYPLHTIFILMLIPNLIA